MARNILEYIQELLEVDGYNFVSLDLKCWERNPNCVLEVGLCFLASSSQKEYSLESHHYGVRENSSLQNGNYLPDNRSGYTFGDTVWCSFNRISRYLQDLLSQDRVVLVGHDFDTQLALLRKKVRLQPTLPIYDTARMWEDRGGATLSLEELLQALDISIEPGTLENAGNDAYYIMTAFLKLTNEPRPQVDISGLCLESSSDFGDVSDS